MTFLRIVITTFAWPRRDFLKLANGLYRQSTSGSNSTRYPEASKNVERSSAFGFVSH
jgi:hypothetical protein